MIYTERTVKISNGVANIDAPIILYRGDRQVEILFKITDSKFKFSSEKGNYIKNVEASFGQLAIDCPDGGDVFTEVSPCIDGAVTFTITGEMIDELYEVGFYSFHIRLFNKDQSSRITIPPIMKGIEIREPIVIEDDDYSKVAMVDYGQVDEAIIENEQATFLDENGNLNIEWKKGDIISSLRLNQMVGYINENAVPGEQGPKGDAPIKGVDYFTTEDKEEMLSGYATESFVNNAIANAQLGGEDGEVNLEGLVAKNEIGNASQILFNDGQSFQTKLDNGSLQGPKGDQGEQGIQGPKGDQGPAGADGVTPVKGVNYFTEEDKTEMLEECEEYVDNMMLEYTGEKKQAYLTQEEYDLLTDAEINDPYTVYNITDAVESVIPVDLAMNDNVLNLVDNDGSVIGEGVKINVNLDLSEYALKTDLPTNVSDLSNDAGYATETFVTNKISEITPSGGTADEVILTSPNGTKFRLVVSDDGVLSAAMIIIRGNIIVSAETLDIVKGMSETFTVQLDTDPSIEQVVNITSDNTAVTVTPNSLTFSSDNYNVAQFVTINVPESAEVIDDSIVTITLSSEGASNKNVVITVQAQELEPESDIISDGILMYFDSDLITASAGTPINDTSINDAMVPNQTLRFRQFKDDGSDGITDDYNGIYFVDKGLMEPMMDDATTVFGETEETSIRTIEIFGKFDGTIEPDGIKNISGICHQHSPVNFSRQLVKRAGDGYELSNGATVVRQMNYPPFSAGNNMASGYFHVAYTDSATKNSEENNICNWLSFAFGSAANMGSLRYTTIYAVRLYNRVLSSDELDHNMAIDLAKVNYTENLQE